MTASPAAPGAGLPTAVAAPPTRGRRLGASPTLFIVVLGIALLSAVRIASGANDITAGGTFAATISLAMPIALAGLGGLWSERAGVVNIGLEGMMILGTWFGAAFSYFSGSPWLGIVGGIVGGLIGGAVHAIATVTFGVDQIISGVAITILSTGLARYLAGVFFTGQGGGGPTQSPSIPTFSSVQVPGARDALIDVERHRWFLVSDLAGLLRAITTALTPFTILMIVLIPLSGFVLWRTTFGLRLRACGENPSEAETLGVNVYRMKYIAVLTSGVFAGLAGAFLADAGGLYREGQTGGRGYIGLAAMIFGNWRPGGLAAGASLFGYTDAVQSRQGGPSVHALLLFVAMLLLALVIWQVMRQRMMPASVLVPLAFALIGLSRLLEVAAITIAGFALLAAAVLVLAVQRHVVPALTFLASGAFLFWYLVTDTVPIEFVPATPYVITLLVLALASQRLRPPAADGVPWRRGQGA